MHDIRIATVIFNSPVGCVDNNLHRMAFYIKQAREQNVKIICFPELCITGYANGNSILNNSVPVDGKIENVLTSLSEKYEITILAGLAEKASDGQVYATHLTVTPQKKIYKYNKLHLAPPEQNTYASGRKIHIFESCGVKFGIQLCYDAHFPELTTQMAIKGVDVVFMPHASPRGTSEEKLKSWMRHLSARAFDNGVFIIAVNQCGENGTGLSFPGVSVALNPSGEIIQKDISNTECLMIVDLKKADLESVRNHRMRYFLPNRRPELYEE